MTKTLDVYLHHELVGHLIQDDGGQMLFSYTESWLKTAGSMALSHSLPLRKEQFTRKQCRGFFAGILPEENKRDIIAANLGISAKNDYAMLEQIGGECAGAVTFIPSGEKLPEHDYHYRALSESEFADILRLLPTRPLMAGDDGVRLSLAGAQDKIAVHMENGKISLPLGGAPSTHIIKPAIERFEGVVFNEAFCMKLAATIGLPTATATFGRAENVDYLMVERYDRKIGSDHITRRLHQEDFCQAMGVVSEMKYQSEGGPSLQQCFALLREVSSKPVIDLQKLLDVVIFNVLIGNHDAHGKNFSILYENHTTLEWEDNDWWTGQSTTLAPFYDLLSTTCYQELSPRMAMRIGGEYESDKLFPKHFEKLAEDAGLSKPMVKKRVPELARTVMTVLKKTHPNHPIAQKVLELTYARCERIESRFSE